MEEKKITKKRVKKISLVLDMDEVIKLLEEFSLTPEQHSKILALCLKEVGYFPIQDIVSKHLNGELLFNGRPMTTEEIVTFRSSLHALKENIAFTMLMDQITFEAIKHGIHYGETVERLLFSKSAIYMVQKFRELINLFDN